MHLRIFSSFALLAAATFSASAQAPLQSVVPTMHLAGAELADAPMSYSSSAASAAAAAVISSGSPSAGVMYGGVRPFSAVGIAVKFGAGGAGFDVAVPLTPRLNLRSGASFFSYSTSVPVDGATFAGSIQLQNSAVMLDFFPFHNTLRLSAGLSVYNHTGFVATVYAPAGQAFTLGNIEYTSDPTDPASGSANIKFGGNVAPRFSMGTGNMLRRKGRFSVESEVGFQYISEPGVTYNIGGRGCTGPNNTNCAVIPASSIAEQQTEIQNDIHDLRFYPIVSLGFSYKLGSTQPR